MTYTINDKCKENLYGDRTWELQHLEEHDEHQEQARQSEVEIEMIILQYQEMCENGELNFDYIVKEGRKALSKAWLNNEYDSEYQLQIYDQLYDLIERLKNERR